MSLYYALWTALAGDWQFARDAVAKSYRLRAHLTLPEPDGTLVGPSHMGSLTSADPPYDQWDSKMRLWAAAIIADDASCLTKMPDAAEIKNAATAAVGEVNVQLHELSWAPDGLEPTPWKVQPPGMPINYAYQYYPKGFYARRVALENHKDFARIPVLREGEFVHRFADEFTIAKAAKHTAIIYTGPVNDPSLPKAYGFGGGALSAFWTPATGSVILGRGVGSWSPRYKTMFDEWRSLPTHAVMGRTADGQIFTSAHIAKPETTIASDDKTCSITARGAIPQFRQPETKLLSGTIDYIRRFESTPAGTQITTTLTGDGNDSIVELYEVIPVFMREAGRQSTVTPTLIEFQADGKWLPATDAYVTQVTEVRLTRFGHAVKITFDRPQRVKLAPADWSDTYQSRATCRNILIDFLENGDQSTPIRAARKISYRIEALPQ